VEKIGVNTALAKAFIATAVMLIVGLAVIPLTTTTAMAAKSDPFAGSDRCVALTDQSDNVISTCCLGNDKEGVRECARGIKEFCKDEREQGEFDKCSSSQTGNGEFCNWVKVRQDKGVISTGGEPPCNEVSQAQNEILNDK
jgi:hypothetical protein